MCFFFLDISKEKWIHKLGGTAILGFWLHKILAQHVHILFKNQDNNTQSESNKILGLAADFYRSQQLVFINVNF
jgi:hypothetical protein